MSGVINNNESGGDTIEITDVSESDNLRLLPHDQFSGNKTDDIALGKVLHAPFKYKLFIGFIMFSIHFYYSCWLFMQSELQVHILPHNNGVNTKPERLYESFVGFTQFGTLVFLFGHNILFYYFNIKSRVNISLICNLISISMLLFTYFILNIKDVLYPIIFICFIAGLTQGTAQPNYLGYINEYSYYAILGQTVGLSSLRVFGNLLLTLNVGIAWIYIISFICAVLSIFIFNTSITSFVDKNRVTTDVTNEIDSPLWNKLKEYEAWLPHLIKPIICEFISLYITDFVNFVNRYIFINDSIYLFNSIEINKDIYFTIIAIFAMINHIIGTYIGYRINKQLYLYFPLLFHSLLFIIGINIFGITPFMAFISQSFMPLTFSIIYSTSIKIVNINIEFKYHVLSLSLFFIMRMLGVFLAQETFEFWLNFVCNNNTSQYYC